MLVKMMQEGVQRNKDQAVDRGRLQINVTSEITAYPIENATISISYTGVPNSILEQLQTNQVGQTEVVELDTPPLEYSLDQTIEEQPYSEYTLQVNAPGFEPISIAGAEILADVTALQDVRLHPLVEDAEPEVYVIPAHTLYGDLKFRKMK